MVNQRPLMFEAWKDSRHWQFTHALGSAPSAHLRVSLSLDTCHSGALSSCPWQPSTSWNVPRSWQQIGDNVLMLFRLVSWFRAENWLSSVRWKENLTRILFSVQKKRVFHEQDFLRDSKKSIYSICLNTAQRREVGARVQYVQLHLCLWNVQGFFQA